MKTLSIIASLVIGLALAWTSFAPQTSTAEDLIGGCYFGPCTSSLLIPCKLVSSSCGNEYRYQCMGMGEKYCRGMRTNPCSGPSPCSYIYNQDCTDSAPEFP